eukprot:c25702_g2_i1 orf=284-778(+)
MNQKVDFFLSDGGGSNNYSYMWKLWRSMLILDPLISFAKTMHDSLGRTIQMPKIHRSKLTSWLISLLEVRAIIPPTGCCLTIGSSYSRIIGAERRGERNHPPNSWHPYKGGNLCKSVSLLLMEIECRRLPSRGLATEKKTKRWLSFLGYALMMGRGQRRPELVV